MIDILEDIKRLDAQLPHFSDGRIDYSHSDTAAVLDIFVIHDNKLLLVKRGDKVLHYKGLWHVVAGYLDEVKPIEYKVHEELREEVGISESQIKEITIFPAQKSVDQTRNKTWIIQPVKVTLNSAPVIILDWEHTEYQWVRLNEINQYPLIPGVADLIKQLSL